MTLDQDALAALDARGYVVLEAVTHAGLSAASTLARPNAFVCIDGKTYWVKSQAQQGLVAELVAGRLAAKVGSGPPARIIRVTHEAIPPDGDAERLAGVVVGSQDEQGAVNAKELEPFMTRGEFRTGVIDAASRARVVVFQTWLGVQDAQVLVQLTRGTVLSIDHGDCFGATGAMSDPAVSVTRIPGVPEEVGKERACVQPAIERVESLTDKDLLEAVAGIPAGEPWKSPVQRRLEIARWLAHRRERLREVMDTWLRT